LEAFAFLDVEAGGDKIPEFLVMKTETAFGRRDFVTGFTGGAIEEHEVSFVNFEGGVDRGLG
jgi:hypothetical protein